MTENMKKFLEEISRNEDMAKKVNSMSKEEILVLAKDSVCS